MSTKFSTIVERRTIGRTVIRSLSCGHEQVEANGGKAHLAATARCFTCYPKEGFTPPPIPKEPPAGAVVPKEAPSVVIAQVKPLSGVKCSRPSAHEQLKPSSFQCEKCLKHICGHCESAPKAGSPCDVCWLEGVGVA